MATIGPAVCCLLVAGLTTPASGLRSEEVRDVEAPDPDVECTIVGSDADDYILGTDGNDVICAGAGNDVIASLDGDDIIWTGPGADVVLNSSGSASVPDFSPGDDSVTKDGTGTVDNERKPITPGDKRLVEYVVERGLETLTPIAPPEVIRGLDEERPEVDQLGPLPPRSAAEHAVDDRRRSGLGLEPTRAVDGAILLRDAAANGSLSAWGVPLTDDELTELEARADVSQFVSAVEEVAASRYDLRSGVFFDLPAGQVVVNIPASREKPAGLSAEVGLPAKSLRLRTVPIPLAELDSEVKPVMGFLIAESESIGVGFSATFDQSDYRYVARVGDPNTEPSAAALELVAKAQGMSDYVHVEVDSSAETAGDPYCDADDCYSVQPGMRMDNGLGGGCSIGLVVNYGVNIGIMSAEHCSSASYTLRPGATSAHRITADETNIQENDYVTGTDHEIYSIVETARGGEAALALMNAVLTGSGDHSNLFSGTRTVAEGDWVCKTGYRSQALGGVPAVGCGTVDNLGDLAPGDFSNGYIEVLGMTNCRGDSGGPVWRSIGGARYSVGLVHGVYNGNFDVVPDICGDDTRYADINRALSNSGASFRNPAGSEMSRRAALRYYDILFNREPDVGGYGYWSQSCSLTSMQDEAFVFTVTGKAEFANRFPLPGGDSVLARANSRTRVRYLWWALQDYDASSGDQSYWGYDYSGGNSYIYGTHSSSSSAREARYDWLAWQLIVNPAWTFSNARMTSTGVHGAPPMCQNGW